MCSFLLNTHRSLLSTLHFVVAVRIIAHASEQRTWNQKMDKVAFSGYEPSRPAPEPAFN